jgi:hypothetical protein
MWGVAPCIIGDIDFNIGIGLKTFIGIPTHPDCRMQQVADIRWRRASSNCRNGLVCPPEGTEYFYRQLGCQLGVDD